MKVKKAWRGPHMVIALLASLSLGGCSWERTDTHEALSAYVWFPLADSYGDEYLEGDPWAMDDVQQMTLTPVWSPAVSATLTANVGVLHFATVNEGWDYDYFGIKNWPGYDKHWLVDDGSGVHEAITITFNRDVVLQRVNICGVATHPDWGEARLSAPGYSTVVSSEKVYTGPPLVEITMDVVVPAGQTVVVEHVSRYGFGLTNFEISTIVGDMERLSHSAFGALEAEGR